MDQDAVRARPEWIAVIEAVDAGDDFGQALDPEKLERATDISIDADGTVTFVVERHPHLLGQPSLGVPSTAYALYRDTYIYDPSSGGGLCGSIHVKNVIDYPALTAQLVESFLECMDLDELREDYDTPAAAERYAREVEWVLPEEGPDLTGEERKEILEACIKYAVELITEE